MIGVDDKGVLHCGGTEQTSCSFVGLPISVLGSGVVVDRETGLGRPYAGVVPACPECAREYPQAANDSRPATPAAPAPPKPEHVPPYKRAPVKPPPAPATTGNPFLQQPPDESVKSGRLATVDLLRPEPPPATIFVRLDDVQLTAGDLLSVARDRLVEVDRQLVQMAALKVERKQLVAIIRTTPKKTPTAKHAHLVIDEVYPEVSHELAPMSDKNFGEQKPADAVSDPPARRRRLRAV